MARSKDKSPRTIEGGRPIRFKADGRQDTGVAFTGDALEPGEEALFILANGVTYSATVDECVEIDGETVATFSDALSPVASK